MANKIAGHVKKVVLLIDDDLPIIDAGTMMLESEGFEVCTAGDSNEAIAHIQAGVLPDIIVTDYRLPGPNGFEVVRRARELLGRDIPALVVTGDTSKVVMQDKKQAKIGVLRKPFKPASFVIHIQEALT